MSYNRKSGVVGFFVRHTLMKCVNLVDSSSEYIAWVKVSKTAYKLDKKYFIWGQQSRFF